MNREFGIARCGLACCLCTQNKTCPGCASDACADKDWCVNRKCSIARGLPGCYACGEEECRKGMLAKLKPYAFTAFARKQGLEELLDCLEQNERAGVVYHREGITGDYDDAADAGEVIAMLRGGRAVGAARGPQS